MAVWLKERKVADSVVLTGHAALANKHMGGSGRKEILISTLSSDREDAAMLAKQIGAGYRDSGDVLCDIEHISKLIGDREYGPSKGWGTEMPPLRAQFTVSTRDGEFGPIMPRIKVFRPFAKYHLKNFILSHAYDAVIVECIGDVMEESEQKNFDYQMEAKDLLFAARGSMVTIIAVNEIRNNLKNEPPTTKPLKNWGRGVSPYAEKYTDECLFIGNRGGDDSPQWLCNPVRGTSELVWADQSAGIFRSVGQLDDYYKIDKNSFALTEEARQLGLLSCADVADHIELESGSWKEVA